MSKTNISWTDETANWIVGCTKISAGCAKCYAATAANSARLQQFPQYKNVVDHEGNWNGHVEFVPKVLDDLLKGKRKRRVFAPSMSDPFHPEVKDEWLDQFFAAVALTPHITYQVLTKRPERMLEYFSSLDPTAKGGEGYSWPYSAMCENPKWPLPNLWLGVTVENQAAAHERIPLLLQAPVAVRFLSIEPMLEEMNIHQYFGRFWQCPECGDSDDFSWLSKPSQIYCSACGDDSQDVPVKKGAQGISWVIIGGESGPNARPFYLEWAESLIEQCKSANVPVFMKQLGSNAFYKGQSYKTKSRAGSDPSEWPEPLRVQEFPVVLLDIATSYARL